MADCDCGFMGGCTLPLMACIALGTSFRNLTQTTAPSDVLGTKAVKMGLEPRWFPSNPVPVPQFPFCGHSERGQGNWSIFLLLVLSCQVTSMSPPSAPDAHPWNETKVREKSPKWGKIPKNGGKYPKMGENAPKRGKRHKIS